MKLRSNLAILVIVASATFAHAQELSVAKMKEDAQKVVKIISSDKSKTHTYCDLVKLSNQIEQAEPNSKKAEELNQQLDELSAKLGPEYIALMGELQDMDRDSEDGKQIASTLEALDNLCAK